MNQIHFHFYIVRRYDFEIVSNYNRISYFIIDDLFIIIMNYSVKSVETSLYRKLLSATKEHNRKGLRSFAGRHYCLC